MHVKNVYLSFLCILRAIYMQHAQLKQKSTIVLQQYSYKKRLFHRQKKGRCYIIDYTAKMLEGIDNEK